MLNRQLLTVGISTLVTGVVTAIALRQPIAVVATSTVGAVGGSLLTRPRSHISYS